FRDERGLDLLAQGGERGDDLALDGVRVQVAHDRGGDLDVLRPELEDRLQARIARARVVDRDLQPRVAEAVQRLAEGGVVVHDFLLRYLDHHVRVRPPDGLEVALVQEHGVPEQAGRGVHEQLLARDRARHLREDRLQAEALELEGHVRLVAHDRAVLDAHHGLVDRVQLAPGQHGPAARHHLEALRGLARLHQPGRLAQAADDVARGPHARVVGHDHRAAVHVHQLHDGAAQPLPQPPRRSVAEADGFLLQPDLRVTAAGGDVEEEVEPVAARELDGQEGRAQGGGLDVRLQALGHAAQDLVVELPAVHALDPGEAAELEVDDAEVAHALVAQVRDGIERKPGDPVTEDALQPQPLQLVHHGRRAGGRTSSRQLSRAYRGPTASQWHLRYRGPRARAPWRAGLSRGTAC